MPFTEDEIRNAGRAIAASKEQVDALLIVLRARQATQERAPAAPVYERVRFDLVHLLWYAGALIVIGAMGLFTTLAFDQMGGRALTVTALVYAVLFTAAGHYLWHSRALTTPGGLMIAIAVAMAPLAVYGAQDAMGWWSGGNPGRYRDFYVWVKSSWLPMEIATVAAGIVALRFYPFPFIVAIIALALWFMSMDLAPWLLAQEDFSWAQRRRVSMAFGLAVMAIAWLVDLKRDQTQDFAFWLHLSGILAFWGGLTLSESDSELAKAMYCLINVALIGLSLFLMRRVYAVFGALGVSLYLGHLAAKVFADSLLFPFALSLIGVGIIGAGLILHRHRPRLSAWMSDRLPEPLKTLRPPHAAAATAMEHA